VNASPVTQPQAETDRLHFLDYWQVITKRKEVIIATAVILIFAATVYSFVKQSQYTATSQVRIETSSTTIEDSYRGAEEPSDVLDRAQQRIFEISSSRVRQGFVPVRTIVKDTFEIIQELYDKKSHVTGVESGFIDLDSKTAGFQKSDLIILAGRPSMGKTSLALNIARNAAIEHGACVALFSLEMARESLVLRLLSSESGVSLSRIRLEHHKEEAEEKRIMVATGVLSEAPIYIDDSPHLRVLEMRAKARRLYYEHGVNLIIVDHLGLMQGDGRMENRVQEISYISRSLKGIARELNVPLIAVSQLSRASEWRASHRPQLSDLRDSGSIEQDADVVVFIYRDEYYYDREEWQTQHPDREYPEGIADIIIAKHRNGPVGQISLRFIPKLAKFENIASVEPSLL
jgi:replicative DNA helicase